MTDAGCALCPQRVCAMAHIATPSCSGEETISPGRGQTPAAVLNCCDQLTQPRITVRTAGNRRSARLGLFRLYLQRRLILCGEVHAGVQGQGHVPVRQRVLSLPIPLRLLLAAQPLLVPSVCSARPKFSRKPTLGGRIRPSRPKNIPFEIYSPWRRSLNRTIVTRPLFRDRSPLECRVDQHCGAEGDLVTADQ